MSSYNSKENKSKVLYHIVFWAFLMSLPLVIFREGTIDYKDVLRHNWAPILVFAFLFYINYLWLIDACFYNKRKKWFIILNVAVIVVFGVINFLVLDFTPPKHLPEPGGMLRRRNPILFILKDFLLTVTPILIAMLLKSSERNIQLERERKEVETRNLETELQGLKYQLKPHFFFNSLNNIYSLIETSPVKAQEVVHALSKLMRYLLYDTGRDKVLLKDDINFLKQYIELMQIRLSKNTSVSYSFQEVKEEEVPPLLFLSMVENSFKHGASSSLPSEIFFKLSMLEDKLIFETKNTNFPKNKDDQSGSGIGNENLLKRLELLYPSKFYLQSKVVDDMYIVTLEISLIE